MFTLTGQDIHGVITTEIITDKERPKGNYLPRERVLSNKGIGRAVSTNESQMPFIKNIPHGYNDGFEKELPSLKSNSGAQYNELLVNNARIRRLTPIECERLQGFPDDWTKELSDTQRYKCLGNAVTVNVIEFLGHKILDSWG